MRSIQAFSMPEAWRAPSQRSLWPIWRHYLPSVATAGQMMLECLLRWSSAWKPLSATKTNSTQSFTAT
jgi:hypothetical protein